MSKKSPNNDYCYYALSLLFLVFCTIEVAHCQYEAKLTFIVLGDWGSAGDEHQPDFGKTQLEVAKGMAEIAEEYPIDFVISVGDNFYENGVTSVNDSNWNESFVNIYTQPSLQTPWYQILGNHDYQGIIDAQLNYHKDSRWILPSLYYSFSLPLLLHHNETLDHREDWSNFTSSSGNITFIMIDTSPFITSYHTDANQNLKTQVKEQNTTAQLEWLETELATAKRLGNQILTFGHHQIYSDNDWADSGPYGGYEELQKSILPLLQKYNVSYYYCGHVHDLEHLQLGNLSLVISGAGSRIEYFARRQDLREDIDDDTPGVNYHSDFPGFRFGRS